MKFIIVILKAPKFRERFLFEIDIKALILDFNNEELFPAIRFYLFIRKKADKKDTASISARQLDSKNIPDETEDEFTHKTYTYSYF